MTRFPARFGGPGPLAALAPVLLFAAGCSDSTKPVVNGNVTDVTLAAAQYSLYAGAQVPGTLRFPAAPGGAQYLVVAQFASGTPDLHAPFTLSNRLAGPVLAASAPAASLASPITASICGVVTPGARRWRFCHSMPIWRPTSGQSPFDNASRIAIAVSRIRSKQSNTSRSPSMCRLVISQLFVPQAR